MGEDSDRAIDDAVLPQQDSVPVDRRTTGAAREKTEEQADIQRSMMGGSGSSGRIATATTVAAQNAASIQHDQKRRDDDAAYVRAIEAAEALRADVAAMFDGMSDAEINKLASDIEAETGMSLEDYAAKHLGDGAAQRYPGESDIEYRRRVLEEISFMMIDPETRQIRPEYVDDPLAQYLTERQTTLREAKYEQDTLESEQLPQQVTSSAFNLV